MIAEIAAGTKLIFTLDDQDINFLGNDPDQFLPTLLGWRIAGDDYEVVEPTEGFDAHGFITAAMEISDALASYTQALENAGFERNEAVQIAIALQTVLLSSSG